MHKDILSFFDFILVFSTMKNVFKHIICLYVYTINLTAGYTQVIHPSYPEYIIERISEHPPFAPEEVLGVMNTQINGLAAAILGG